MREMKDSGIEWIGEIPKDWKVKRLKYLYDYTGGSPVRVGPFGSELNSKEFQSEGIWVYNQRTVLDENFISNDVFITEEKAKKLSAFTVKTNDILITTRGTIGKIAIVPNCAEPGIIHPCIIRFRINSKLILSRYVKYIFNDTDITMNQIFYKSNGSTIEVLYSYNLRDILLPLPSITQQINIIDFLDTQCSEIDATAEDIQKEISLLEEYKKSLIYNAISNGINHSAYSNETDEVWGNVPQGWKLVDIKYLFEIVKRIAGKEGYHVLSVTQNGLKVKDITSGDGQLADNYSGYQFVYPTDYVMNHMDLLTGWVDCSELFGVTSPDYRVFRLMDKAVNNLVYYKYVMQCCYMNKIFYSLGQGVSNLGRWRLQTSSFNNFKVPVPPKAEQDEIADYLDSKCSEIDTLIADKKRQLDILADYKKSLIYEYVTGKKEVPVNE